MEIRRDLFVSIAKAMRIAHLQKPKLAIAKGQGAAIALLFTLPLVVGALLAARAGQPAGAHQPDAASRRAGVVVWKGPPLWVMGGVGAQ